MSLARTSDLWWRNAILYCLDVETFLDWDGDGVGDLAGLIERVDHVAGLGASCLWLMPFQPSPGKDDGYDITDHTGVDPRLGTNGDLVALLRTAKDRGLRVIVDLVVNHTSDQHPWFQAARRGTEDPRHDWYVWRDEPPEDQPAPVFPDAEDSVWTKDEACGRWYLHHFYRHQPDLNVAHQPVREEIARIAGYWLQLGIDGFRVDAVPFLAEQHGNGAEPEEVDPHELLRDLRSFTSRRSGGSVLLGEVNLPAEELVRYFGGGEGDELQLLFDFPLMQRTWLALARGSAEPIREALRGRPEVPEDAQWAIFLRNHDELTLDQLSDAERQEVFDAFGPEPEHQLYDRGLRRRLPSMLGGDPDRIRLAYSLLLTLPGTPVLFYGEEIGMAEDLRADGRMSVRTPMQWTDEPAGGFSVHPERVERPIPEGPFSPEHVNVAAQRRDPGSLLLWFERAIRRRRETPELGWGAWQLLDAGHDAVLAHRADWEGTAAVALHNLSAEEVEVDVALGDVGSYDQVVDLLGSRSPVQDLPGDRLRCRLQPYGHPRLRLQARDRLTAP